MSPRDTGSARRSGSGLRVRLWIGCLAGSLLSAGAIALLLARSPDLASRLDPEFRWVWLPGILGAAVLLSFALAWWLDRGIVRPLRGLTRGLAEGQIVELRGLPSTSGWGEISELTLEAQAMLARHRNLARAGAELTQLCDQLIGVHQAIERGSKSGTWEPLRVTMPAGAASGALAPLLGALNRELARASASGAASREASGALESESRAALEEVRDLAEQSERGFVEATALLTTVRELERLASELDTALGMPRAATDDRARVAGEAVQGFRAAAADAIGRLVVASSESVAHLAGGMQRVQEIADQTRVIANRATLIALHALTGRQRTTTSDPVAPVGEDLKSLAREVREANDRVGALTAEIEQEAATARERMASVRTEVAAVLDSVPTPEASPETEVAADSVRLMERVREMIRDATAKGERLSSTGERASRAAERLKRRIESEVESVDRLLEAFGVRPAEPAPGTRFTVLERDEVRPETGAERPPRSSAGDEEERA